MINVPERRIGALAMLTSFLETLGTTVDDLEGDMPEDFMAGVYYVGSLLEVVHKGLLEQVNNESD